MSPPFEDPRREKPHLLVVDDEPLVRELLVRRLQADGYRVSFVENAMQAFDLLNSAHSDVDCVVCDQVMPGPAGLFLLDYLASSRPSVGRVLYTGKDRPEVALAGGKHETVIKANDTPRLLVGAIERELRRVGRA